MRTQKRCLGHVAVVVDDYDRAIEYYTDKLGFILVEDTPQPGKRWVVVAPVRRAIAISCWPERQTRRRKVSLATSAAVGCFCSSRRMISGAITTL